jgi:hypothetical protein
MADTPNLAPLKVGFNRKINDEAWSVPVEPKSTSASPLPKIVLPDFCKFASTKPRKVGVEPNGPVQRCVPKKLGSNSHWSPVTASVPLAETEIAGSLSPSARVKGVLEKLKLPGVVAARAAPDGASMKAATSIIDKTFRETGKMIFAFRDTRVGICKLLE